MHLSTWHTQKDPGKRNETAFHCQLCDFVEPGTDSNFLTHLCGHLRLKQKVSCPYQGCNFQSSNYSTFNAHKSKEHPVHSTMAFKSEILSGNIPEEPPPSLNIQAEDNVSVADDSDFEVVDSEDAKGLESQLEHNVAALFLKMSSVLNISETSLQEVIEQINQMYSLSQPLLHTSLQRILDQPNDSLVGEIVREVSKSNAFLRFTSPGGSLSTASKRKAYILNNFSVVMPIEFVLKNDKQTVVYVPILQMLQALLANKDILDKAMSPEANLTQTYNSFRDGSCFKSNSLLKEQVFRIVLFL